MKVDIDKNSGFCGGVIRAIKKAEGFLQENSDGHLYSLGAIVHNDAELARLHNLGLTTIDYEDLLQIDAADSHSLLIRAHGEPPSTYKTAQSKGFEIIDCTCPVVLDLQKSIREAHENFSAHNIKGQIIIFGQIGHAETLGLMGQAPDTIVIENMNMLKEALKNGDINPSLPTEIFSQTTKSPSEFESVIDFLEGEMAQACGTTKEELRQKGLLGVHNTICTQVAARQARLSEFAACHDIVIFVSGKASSNGKVLCSLCKNMNIRTYHIEKAEELRPEWFRQDDNVGVCGATSTPRWLLEQVADKILEIGENLSNFASENKI